MHHVHIIWAQASENIVLPDWNANLNNLHNSIAPDNASLVDLTPYGAVFTAADSADVPKEDLSFGIAGWHGTGGTTRSARNGDKVIQWTAP